MHLQVRGALRQIATNDVTHIESIPSMKYPPRPQGHGLMRLVRATMGRNHNISHTRLSISIRRQRPGSRNIMAATPKELWFFYPERIMSYPEKFEMRHLEWIKPHSVMVSLISSPPFADAIRILADGSSPPFAGKKIIIISEQ